ncbi:MAG: serine hydrolase [Candidatus Aminicenantes bacterium]|nr:serine hydrolase [Candidatus Aminicenantes bacterium]
MIPEEIDFTKAEKIIKRIMKKGKIPGACIVVSREGEEDIIKGFGYADVKKKIPVTPDTLFELASCSKSFTGLALLQLEEKKLVDLNDPVAKYFPWFYVRYYEKKHDITIRHLLRHTSGIPWEAISVIQADKSKDALQKIVKKISGIELNSMPGKRFAYATVNYDIIGAIIEKVSGQSFEDYMRENVFRPLRLDSTTVGAAGDNPLSARGYKSGLFSAGRYDAPVFRGNNPAGYVVSNGRDMARWLKLQLGLIESPMATLIKKTRRPGKMPAYSRRLDYSYGMGWIIDTKKGKEISHTGLNPTFSSYAGFSPKKKIGAAVLVNSNSPYTLILAEYIMSLFTGERRRRSYFFPFAPGRYSPVVSFFLGIYLALLAGPLFFTAAGILREVRRYTPLTGEEPVILVFGTLVFLGLFFGFLSYPYMYRRTNWRTIFVWSAKGFVTAFILFLISLGLSYLLFFLRLFFQ